MKTYTIQVTQDDINKGEKKSCTSCPIALALRSFKENVFYILVNEDEISFNNNFIPTPLIARNFIKMFDRGDKVHPFSFELALEKN